MVGIQMLNLSTAYLYRSALSGLGLQMLHQNLGFRYPRIQVGHELHYGGEILGALSQAPLAPYAPMERCPSSSRTLTVWLHVRIGGKPRQVSPWSRSEPSFGTHFFG